MSDDRPTLHELYERGELRARFKASDWTTKRPAESTATARTVAVSSTALLGLGAYTGSIVPLVVATLGVIAAVYEWLAVRTNDFPTITEAIKGGGWPLRIVFTAAAVLAFVDHFLVGYVL